MSMSRAVARVGILSRVILRSLRSTELTEVRSENQDEAAGPGKRRRAGSVWQ